MSARKVEVPILTVMLLALAVGFLFGTLIATALGPIGPAPVLKVCQFGQPCRTATTLPSAIADTSTAWQP